MVRSFLQLEELGAHTECLKEVSGHDGSRTAAAAAPGEALTVKELWYALLSERGTILKCI